MGVNIQIAVTADAGAIPKPQEFAKWTACVLHSQSADERRDVCIRIVGNDESATLNQTFRNKTGPTNVLSFPSEKPPGLPASATQDLGDLVICAPLVAVEAAQQCKQPAAHWAHLVVHGTLHLLGFDHSNTTEAAAMESLEIDLLQQLAFPNPYIIEHQSTS